MEEKVKELIEPIITENGYILDEVLYIMEENTRFLRIIIDANKAVLIEDCVKVCKLINPILDQIDFIKEHYILDVCSKEKGNI